jgi:hypothetical protein
MKNTCYNALFGTIAIKVPFPAYPKRLYTGCLELEHEADYGAIQRLHATSLLEVELQPIQDPFSLTLLS